MRRNVPSNVKVSTMRAAFGAIIAVALGVLIASAVAANATASGADSVLPNGWLIRPPQGLVKQTDTMPQGGAVSPDGKILAVVDSGFNPATLRLYKTANLDQVATVALNGAFGRPLWIDSGHVLVAGDNADAIFELDVSTRLVHKIAMPAKSHPIEIARARDGTIAVADDGDGGPIRQLRGRGGHEIASCARDPDWITSDGSVDRGGRALRRSRRC
jgi:hypothetical protein